jgi:sigma-B regulation protein RsbU (phosphoserine phosphatase)
LVVGPLKDSTYAEEKMMLAGGDTIFLYTDGVTEAMDPAGKLFSEEQLIRLLGSFKNFSVEGVVQQTISAVKNFEAEGEQADDITILAIQFTGAKQQTGDQYLELTIKNEIEEIGKAVLRFEKFAEKNQLPNEVVSVIQIVLEELLSNTINYGFADDRRHEIKMKVRISIKNIRLTIIDDGIPFNPLDSKTPDIAPPLEQRKIGGLGVHIVRTMMDSVFYERVGNKNKVVVVKNIEVEES